MLRARYVFPVCGPPIENGAVTFEAGQIVAVDRWQGGHAIDLGDVAIIPGLVNAHTHLEFSDLASPLGEPGMPLPSWIREVVRYRAEQESLAATSGSVADSVDPIANGIVESARYGVVTIGEIATRKGMADSPLSVARYFELRGLREPQVNQVIEDARQVSHECDGLAPHAPYSVHSRLLDVAIACQRPLAMHLAESPEELELLQTSRGPFRDLLDERGWWTQGAIPIGARPLDYLRKLAQAPRSIVVHGNYLNDEELRFLGTHRGRMSIVYCPRTHAYFRHAKYPLAGLAAHGAIVALGTDSRASNPDLDLRAEAAFAIEHHCISPEEALRMVTLNGAIALGLADQCGTIIPSQPANLAVLRLAEKFAADPHELLFDPSAQVVAAISRGRIVNSDHPSLPIDLDCARAPL